MNRLDLGMLDVLEFGLFVIQPKDKPISTWVNLQGRILKEEGFYPTLSVGVWDMATMCSTPTH